MMKSLIRGMIACRGGMPGMPDSMPKGGGGGLPPNMPKGVYGGGGGMFSRQVVWFLGLRSWFRECSAGLQTCRTAGLQNLHERETPLRRPQVCGPAELELCATPPPDA